MDLGDRVYAAERITKKREKRVSKRTANPRQQIAPRHGICLSMRRCRFLPSSRSFSFPLSPRQFCSAPPVAISIMYDALDISPRTRPTRFIGSQLFHVESHTRLFPLILNVSVNIRTSNFLPFQNRQYVLILFNDTSTRNVIYLSLSGDTFQKLPYVTRLRYFLC